MNLDINESLQSIKASVEELHSVDKQYLSTLFRCKDEILKCLSITETLKKKSKGTIEKLYELEDYLNDEKTTLLSIFLDRYCLHAITDDELKDLFMDSLHDKTGDLASGIDPDDIPVVDSYVYRYMGEKLFNSLNKDNANVLYNGDNMLLDLWGDDGSDIVENFIPKILAPKLDSFLESEETIDKLQDEICKEKGIESTQEIHDFFHGGLDMVKKEYLKSEKSHTLSVYNDMIEEDTGPKAFSIEKGGESYTLLFLFVLSKKHIYNTLKQFISSSLDYFMNKKGYAEFEGDMSFALSLSIDQMINAGSGLSDPDFVSSKVKELLMITFDKDLLLGVDGIDVSFNNVKSGLTAFGSSMAAALVKLGDNYDMKILSKDFDENLNPKKERDGTSMETVYKRHKPEMNRYIINKIYSELQKVINKEFSNICEWDDEKKEKIIQSLYDKYPNASKNLRFKLQGKAKGKERKERFLSKYISKLKKDLNDYFIENQEEILELKFVDFNVIGCYYIITVSKIIKSMSLDEEFDKYVIADIEPLFADSHRRNTERNKIEAEKNQAEEGANEEVNLFIDSIKDIIGQALYNIPTFSNNNSVFGHKSGAEPETTGAIELPSELLSQLSEYFDGSIDYLLKKYLTKIYGKGGYYKKQWFEKYSVKQDENEFFDILNRHGFTCEDDIEQKKDVSEMYNGGGNDGEKEETGTIENDDKKEDNSELLKLFDEAILIESSDEKMEKLCDILIQLGYNFDNREKMKALFIDRCTSNKVLSTGFENIVRNLINGTVIEEKKQKSWNGNPVYSIAVGNTGHRLLIQTIGDEKYIFNFMPHNEYITFLTKNCK